MGSKKPKENIPSPQLPNQKLKFSFEYYDESEKYCLSHFSQKQIKTTLTRLKEISTKTFQELKKDRRIYHFTEVDWQKTVEKNGFPDNRLNRLSPFHFALLGVHGQRTRVFAAYAENTLYIVWFDLEHKIWPSQLKHT